MRKGLGLGFRVQGVEFRVTGHLGIAGFEFLQGSEFRI